MEKRTTAIHGSHTDIYDFHKGVAHPINIASTFYFDTIKEAEDTFDGKLPGHVYSRGRNPSLDEFEEKMTLLEEGGTSVCFASGMGAIATLLLSILKAGDSMLAHKILYGSSHNLIANVLPEYGIKTQCLNLKAEEALKEALKKNPKVIYFETPCNPTLDIIDIKRVREIAGPDVLIIVDNTFATPFLQQPLKQGADFVVHSATKYIGGHGDALGGVVVCKDKEYDGTLRFGYMCELGAVLSPFNAWLFTRGLKTLKIRMDAHSKSAMEVAEFLESHSKVRMVAYPGLKSFGDHELAKRQMEGFGGMIAFEIEGTEAEACLVVEKLNIFKLAVSLGDVESLVQHPMRMTHRCYTEEECRDVGVDKSLIRLSIGLEDPKDLIKDLDQALGSL